MNSVYFYVVYLLLVFVLFFVFVVVYLKVILFDELVLICDGNVVVMLLFGGVLIGFCLMFVFSIVYNVMFGEVVIWVIGVMIV